MNATLNNTSFSEATGIDALKIFDSCSDKDCLEDMPVTFSAANQQIINGSSYVKSNCAEVSNCTFAIEPVPFHNGFYAVDITYAFNVFVDAYSSTGGMPTQVTGTCCFTKKVILFGSEGHTKTFSSDQPATITSNNGCCCSCESTLPIATVSVVDPIVLDIKSTCRPLCGCNQADTCANYAADPIVAQQAVAPAKYIYATLGLFSVVELSRRVPLLVPTYEYSLPEKECTSNTDSPCELFSQLAFPVSEFIPPNLEDSSSDNDSNNCGCAASDSNNN